jgi:hypothetical protein
VPLQPFGHSLADDAQPSRSLRPAPRPTRDPRGGSRDRHLEPRQPGLRREPGFSSGNAGNRNSGYVRISLEKIASGERSFATADVDACGLTAIIAKTTLAGHDPVINHFWCGEAVNVYKR